jgi:hypothetical protein
VSFCGDFLNIAELKPGRIDLWRASPNIAVSFRQRSVFARGEESDEEVCASAR